ncbi:MAG: glutamate synthase large subunit, partial [Alphaproteobacteria bacterium]
MDGRTPNQPEDYVSQYHREAAALERDGLYRASDEHDACGVGLIAALDGKARRDVVVAGINALRAVWHRGAVDADGKTGDGAGIHVEIPQDFFKEHIRDTGHEPKIGRLAVGMVFLPRTDLAAQERCRAIVETEILNFGHTIYGWRQVPVDISVIGEKANASRPEIEQVLIANSLGVENREFERQLYIIRRRIERAVLAATIIDFYICSLSCRSVIYKGMFLAEHLAEFYPDLKDERFVSRFTVFHQRYSTNTFPTWRLAQPFRILAHNGEINTLLGNVNWMKSHETRLAHEVFGKDIEDLKPVIQAGGSDSAALDNVFELLTRGGRSLPMVKAMMIPEASTDNPNVTPEHRAMYSYLNAVMEPWDGPAAIAAYAGRWVVAGLDRNGLRPMRYTLTSDGLLIAGSETGMVPVEESKVVEKGRLGPGQMIGVDIEAGKLYRDRELKDAMATARPYAEWTTRTVALDSLIRKARGDTPANDRQALRTHQTAVG